MKKGFLLMLIAFFLCQLTVVAQNYDRYNYFHDEAVKLKNEGKLNEAKEKFKKIRVVCKGGIPEDNDLDKMIRECTTMSFSESELQFDAKGNQTKQVNVKVNADSFKASSNAKWCKVNKKGNAVAVSCERNDSPVTRTASVSVSADGKTMSFGVSQHGGNLEFEAVPDKVHFSKESEIVGVSITTNADSWDVDYSPLWIECQVNDSMLYLTSKQNNLASVREDTLYLIVIDERFPIAVSQAASDTTISADKEKLEFPSDESEMRMAVLSNLNQWRASTSDDWILVFAETDAVKVRVKQNESLFSRHGWVKLESGTKSCQVPVHQFAFASALPKLTSEIKVDAASSKGSVAVNSLPSDLKVTVIDDAGESSVKYTPFDLPVDYGHYSLQMGFERREVFANEQQQDVVFKPGLRFAALTWSPKHAFGMMSGFVSANAWGAYTHVQANTPFVSNYNDVNRDLAGYNITFGPVFRPNKFPYLGAYAGVGIGGYVREPHVGLDYEAGLMGFYKNVMITAGFHTSRMFKPSTKSTGFVVGVGGYLKRYYDPELGYCASDSRRWISVNYVFRPSEKGKGFMVGDLGSRKVRGYIKALYLLPEPSMVLPTEQLVERAADSLKIRNLEGSVGVLFTPVNGLIDLCIGASAAMNITGLEKRFQGIGVEAGTILNIWRFPITMFLHESDILGERHLCVDFGIGFHLGEFGKSKCSYQ
jgi:hypothetical protein